METRNEKVIEQLNKLVEINNDRVQGYENAAKESIDSDLKSLFIEMSNHSRRLRTDLSNEIRKLGGTPTEGTKNTGKIFRVWMDIKAALTGKNRKEIIGSCETGEDAALEVYEEVLKSEVLIAQNLKDLVLKQKQEIQTDHNRIRTLRDVEKSKANV